MAKCGIITLTQSTAGTDNFQLFSDDDGFSLPFESGIPRSALIAGYPSNLIPDAATIVEVKSNNTCTNSIYITLPVAPTPTPSPALLGFRINPGAFSTYSSACAATTTYDDAYLSPLYEDVPQEGFYFYQNPDGTGGWAADPNLWQMVTYGGNKWAVRLNYAPPGYIEEVIDCSNLPTPTPTRTPTVTPTPTPTQAAIAYGIYAPFGCAGSPVGSFNNSTDACNSLVAMNDFAYFAPGSGPIIGEYLYCNSSLTLVWDGDGEWWRLRSPGLTWYALLVDTNGEILSVVNCSLVSPTPTRTVTPTPTKTPIPTPSNSPAAPTTPIRVTVAPGMTFAIDDVVVNGTSVVETSDFFPVNGGQTKDFHSTEAGTGMEIEIYFQPGGCLPGDEAITITRISEQDCVDSGCDPLSFNRGGSGFTLDGNLIWIQYGSGTCAV